MSRGDLATLIVNGCVVPQDMKFPGGGRGVATDTLGTPFPHYIPGASEGLEGWRSGERVIYPEG